jgi:hypothetical protein
MFLDEQFLVQLIRNVKLLGGCRFISQTGFSLIHAWARKSFLGVCMSEKSSSNVVSHT